MRYGMLLLLSLSLPFFSYAETSEATPTITPQTTADTSSNNTSSNTASSNNKPNTIPQSQPETKAETLQRYANDSIYDKPLMERYVLDELKLLRTEQQDLERRMMKEITDRELSVADKSMNYANVTVTYFFYLIAGAASLFALIGWQSLKELRDNTKKVADQQLQDIAEQYEKKFQLLEQDLKRKTRIIAQNNKEIETINEIHNLWLRSQNLQTPEQRIDVYDEILKIRPGDLEALTYKADAAMETREFNWALSLCNRVLELDPSNAHALYQRACAFACLGSEEQAINDLEMALQYTASLRELAAEERDFESLWGNDRFESLVAPID
ncbi:TPR repeat containing protein [Photobacterium aphoticum]|uniref:TPR repeat containing protein n=1 Tax=Photobacterium aphoticum TaxID=754436 RepID=A0A090QQ36_9GAMM|nr:TPR repeat containing protein [Photobacterium aphoticum]